MLFAMKFEQAIPLGSTATPYNVQNSSLKLSQSLCRKTIIPTHNKDFLQLSPYRLALSSLSLFLIRSKCCCRLSNCFSKIRIFCSFDIRGGTVCVAGALTGTCGTNGPAACQRLKPIPRPPPRPMPMPKPPPTPTPMGAVGADVLFSWPLLNFSTASLTMP